MFRKDLIGFFSTTTYTYRILQLLSFLVRWLPQRTLVPSFFLLLYLPFFKFFVSSIFQITVISCDWSWTFEHHIRISGYVWGMRGRVCAGVHGCAQVCTSVHTCMWVGAGVCGCAWVCGSAQVSASVCVGRIFRISSGD